MNQNTKLIAASLALVTALFSTGAAAGGDPARGKDKAATCVACHGETGVAIDPNYPNLAGQYESYLVKALTDYRSGARTNAIMASFAKNLSNQDIEDLAAWYARQDGLVDLSIK